MSISFFWKKYVCTQIIFPKILFLLSYLFWTWKNTKLKLFPSFKISLKTEYKYIVEDSQYSCLFSFCAGHLTLRFLSNKNMLARNSLCLEFALNSFSTNIFFASAKGQIFVLFGWLIFLIYSYQKIFFYCFRFNSETVSL